MLTFYEIIGKISRGVNEKRFALSPRLFDGDFIKENHFLIASSCKQSLLPYERDEFYLFKDLLIV
jgi:hypothetical protein